MQNKEVTKGNEDDLQTVYGEFATIIQCDKKWFLRLCDEEGPLRMTFEKEKGRRTI